MARRSFAARANRAMAKIDTGTFHVGFSHIDKWVSSSNYAMNRLWSGRFDRAFLYGRNYVFYGESGSGKSLFCAITAGNAQREDGAYVVWIDVEHATDDEEGRKWLIRAGVDLDEEKFMYVNAVTLEEIKKTISAICNDYRAEVKAGTADDLPPVVFVVDSWAAAMTESQTDRTFGKKAGEMVGDMGQKAKQVGDLIQSVTHLCSGIPVMVIGVQHIMDNQEGYGRKHKTTGGNKMQFYSSGSMMLTKSELRMEDTDDGEVVSATEKLNSNMLADAAKAAGGKKRITGIVSTMEIIKSRVSKPFEKIKIQIPYMTGIDKYSGLFDLMMQEGVIIRAKRPGYYKFMEETGEYVEFTLKTFREHADRIMEIADSDISGGVAIAEDGENSDEYTVDETNLPDAVDEEGTTDE